MKFLALAFTLVALVSADVSHLGYNYNQGAASSQGQARFESGGGSFGDSGVGSFGHSGGSLGHGGASGSSFGGVGVGGSYGGASSGSLEHGRSGYLDYSSGASGGGPATIVKPVVRHGEPIVSKSFFVHEAPEEGGRGVHVEEKEHIVHPRKHYNIIFVKTPLAGGNSVSSNNVNVFPENEEKTIVYVLTGRNDGVNVDSNGDIQLPQPKAPVKPEVVFVKYNNEADAQRAISDIQANYNNQQGSSVSVLGVDGGAGVGSVRSGAVGGSQSVGHHGNVGSSQAVGVGGQYGNAVQYGLRRNRVVQNVARNVVRRINPVRRAAPKKA